MADRLTDDTVHGPPPPPEGWGWGGDDPSSDGPGASRRASLLGLYLLIVSSSMVFLSLAAAFLMRRSIATQWVSMAKPPILWLNTALLGVASLFLERARRALKAGGRNGFNRWWTVGTLAGVLFLAGQALAWWQLKQAGFYMAANVSTSFFYILTATHAAHVLGAVAALGYVDFQALRFTLGPAKRTAIDVSAIFWHFLGVLWVLLMVLFYTVG
jgi:cytochrome c oxidase subunit 3